MAQKITRLLQQIDSSEERGRRSVFATLHVALSIFPGLRASQFDLSAKEDLSPARPPQKEVAK
jgi:hypothetical protein